MSSNANLSMIENLLRLYKERGGDPAILLAELIKQLRPASASHPEHALHALQALCHVLQNQPQLAPPLRDAILTLLAERKPVSLYVDSGIQPSSGFFSEMWRRISHKILPDAVDQNYLKDLFAHIFTKPGDEHWVFAVPDSAWLELLQALSFDQAPVALLSACMDGLLDGVQVLSYRISALGLEPELIRNHPELEDHQSPFIVQNIELNAFLAGRSSQPEKLDQPTDELHVLVMLDQCREIIARIRRNSSQSGTSIHLTFLLQRLTQQITRLETLLQIVVSLRASEDSNAAFIALFKTLVSAEGHKNDVAQHWRENTELMALRVTENASRAGEHYITQTRREYLDLLYSAMGAGLIIAVMSMLKIIVASKHMPPLTEAIVFSLNYGLGFVLIHILHFTVATKQPAMTAAAIAASIGESGGKAKEMDNLAVVIAQTMRSQFIAIMGNVVVVVPMAMLIAWLIYMASGVHFVTPEKARQLLVDVNPVQSGAVFYAAIAGVCLFLSGLVAGYHDNLAIYNKIPQRLRALGWLQKLLGQARLDRVAAYIENNLGALAGNFYFGCMLGGMAAVGVLLGLPVDIRHVTFSSAFVGYALIGLDFDVPLRVLLMACLGVALIAMANLLVSFALALYVAMKSRKVTFAQWRMLVKAMLLRLYQHPREFFLPPGKDETESVASRDTAC